jgi:hypothetical protein
MRIKFSTGLFDFSKHALEQMLLRDISVHIVEKVLKNPDEIIDDNDKRIYQSVISFDDMRYLIRIFVNHHKAPNLVITVYKTSKIRKYYEGKI